MDIRHAVLIMLMSYHETKSAFESTNKRLDAGAYFRTYIAQKVKEHSYDDETRVYLEDLCKQHTDNKNLSKAIFALHNGL